MLNMQVLQRSFPLVYRRSSWEPLKVAQLRLIARRAVDF